MSVQRVRVGDVLRLERRSVEIDPLGEYREIGVRSFGRGIFHKEPITGSELGTKRVFHIEPGDLVFSNVFSWEGAVALAGDSEQGLIGSHRFMTYVPRDDRLLPAWAAWFFVSEPGLELLGAASPGSAGRNRTLAIERFENLEIPLPSLDEQQRVVAEIDAVSAAAAQTAAHATRSDAMREALRDSLTLEPSAGEWRSWSGTQVLSLRPVEVDVEQGAVYPVAGVYSFGRGLFSRADLEGGRTSYRVLHRLEVGQLVMSRLKAWEGALAVVPAEFAGAHLSPEFPTFDINMEVADPAFLGALVSAEAFWSRLRGASKGVGARKERVHADRLLEQEFRLPPLEEQRRRAGAIQSLRRASELAANRRRIADALVPSTLNQVFAGPA